MLDQQPYYKIIKIDYYLLNKTITFHIGWSEWFGKDSFSTYLISVSSSKMDEHSLALDFTVTALNSVPLVMCYTNAILLFCFVLLFYWLNQVLKVLSVLKRDLSVRYGVSRRGFTPP